VEGLAWPIGFGSIKYHFDHFFSGVLVHLYLLDQDLPLVLDLEVRHPWELPELGLVNGTGGVRWNTHSAVIEDVGAISEENIWGTFGVNSHLIVLAVPAGPANDD